VLDRMAHVHPEAEVMPMQRKPPPDRWNLVAAAPAVLLDPKAHGQGTVIDCESVPLPVTLVRCVGHT
jgi:hypothetical protein